jgi:Mce-associated membrane protein
MTTTRQTINHQRRVAARPGAAGAVAQARTGAAPGTATATAPGVTAEPGVTAAPEPAAAPDPAAASGRPRRRLPRLRFSLRTLPRPRRPLVAVLLTLLLGCFAGYAHTRAADLDAVAGHDNTALTDAARTSQVKGSITQAVDTLFSYDYTDPARTDDAAKTLLVGSAVPQYTTMLSAVRSQADRLKLVLTTTVTDCGVEQLDGDRAQLLIFADQRDTTASAGATASSDSQESPAMFTVSAVLRQGSWRISSINTFTG